MKNSSSLLKKLESLPKKAALPLMQLLSLEQVDEDVITAILDLTMLGGNPDHVLAYAVAYQHLVSKGVPMKDTISMARQLKRNLNPRWSRTRWMEEHRKLGRAMTLIALADKSKRYDLAPYLALLPQHWKGYLIPSSRRLGAEGLRQDHCVANYHSSIDSGNLAIAAVFVDKVRWTVELAIYNEAIAIRQIKSRFNKPATHDVVKRIHDELGVEIKTPKSNEDGYGDNRRSVIDENLVTVINRLRMLEVTEVCADFDGYGDSGSVDAPVFSTSNEMPARELSPILETTVVQYHVRTSRWDTLLGVYTYSYDTEETSLYDAIQRVIDDQIDDTGVDWYNNDGGSGSYRLNVVTGTYDLSVDSRYTESETMFSVEDEPVDGL